MNVFSASAFALKKFDSFFSSCEIFWMKIYVEIDRLLQSVILVIKTYFK